MFYLQTAADRHDLNNENDNYTLNIIPKIYVMNDSDFQRFDLNYIILKY